MFWEVGENQGTWRKLCTESNPSWIKLGNMELWGSNVSCYCTTKMPVYICIGKNMSHLYSSWQIWLCCATTQMSVFQWMDFILGECNCMCRPTAYWRNLIKSITGSICLIFPKQREQIRHFQTCELASNSQLKRCLKESANLQRTQHYQGHWSLCKIRIPDPMVVLNTYSTLLLNLNKLNSSIAKMLCVSGERSHMFELRSFDIWFCMQTQTQKPISQLQYDTQTQLYW